MTRRRVLAGISLACVAVGVFLALSALDVGADGGNAASPSPPRPVLLVYHPATPHVASEYELYAPPRNAPRSDLALDQPLPDERPRPAEWFVEPVDRYRAYAVAQLGRMGAGIGRLERALEANNRDAARAAWRAAYSLYLHLGAVYLVGEVASLNQAIDGTAGGLTGGTASPQFTGLHRIEYGLWTDVQPRALVGWARQLAVAVTRMRQLLPHVSITPLEYATRAHEILEDAVRDLLSGAEVPWSGEGVLATKAGLEATEEVLSMQYALIPHETHLRPILEAELAAMRATIAQIAAAHGGRLPPNGQLSQRESELLDGTLGGALEALAQVPGALESETIVPPPRIPRNDVRIDP